MAVLKFRRRMRYWGLLILWGDLNRLICLMKFLNGISTHEIVEVYVGRIQT